MTKINVEQFIFRKMAEGDKEAFRFFFDKYYNDLCNFVNIYVHDQQVSEELVQDLFVYFWESKGKIKINLSVKAYLYSASKYKSFNYLRDTKNIEPLSEHILESTSDSENYFDFEELSELIKQSIEKLPRKCREIFKMSQQRGLTYKEIANNLNISEKTVENQIGIAFKKLRLELKPHYDKIFIFMVSSLIG